MNRILPLTLLIFTMVLSTNSFGSDDTVAQHFGDSATFGYMAENVLHQQTDLDVNDRVLSSTAMALVPGLVKELIDPIFDAEDMAFNVMGAFVGALVGQYFNKYVFVGFERDEATNSNGIGFKLTF